MDPITLGLLSSASALAIYYARRRHNKKLPGPENPLLGGLPSAIAWSFKNKHKLQRERLLQLRDEYGPIFGYTVGPLHIIVVNEAATIRYCLNHSDFQGKPQISLLEMAFEGRGVVMAEGVTWRKHRRITTQALRNLGMGTSQLENIMLIEITRLEDELLHAVQDENGLDPADFLPKLSINIITSLLFSRNYEYSNSYLKKILNMTSDVNEVNLFAVILPLLVPCLDKCNLLRLLPSTSIFMESVSGLYNEIRKYIDHRRNHYGDENNNATTDFLDFMLDEQALNLQKDFFNDKNIEADCVQLLLAGSENTNVTLRWALLHLAIEPRLQERLRDNFNRIDLNAGIWEQRNCLPLLLAFVEEVLRLHTPVGFTIKTPRTNGLKLLGYEMPKNAMLVMNLYAANMDANIWPNPHEFLPERHLNEEGKFSKSIDVLSFSVGRRACLGEILARQEIFLTLFRLLSRMQIILPAFESGRLKNIFLGTEGVTCRPQSHRLRFIPLIKNN